VKCHCRKHELPAYAPWVTFQCEAHTETRCGRVVSFESSFELRRPMRLTLTWPLGERTEHVSRPG